MGVRVSPWAPVLTLADQSSFDFDAPPELVVTAPGSEPEVGETMRAWLALGEVPEPCGPPSGAMCATCKRPILVDDDFGDKFGEHVGCF